MSNHFDTPQPASSPFSDDHKMREAVDESFSNPSPAPNQLVSQESETSPRSDMPSNPTWAAISRAPPNLFADPARNRIPPRLSFMPTELMEMIKLAVKDSSTRRLHNLAWRPGVGLGSNPVQTVIIPLGPPPSFTGSNGVDIFDFGLPDLEKGPVVDGNQYCIKYSKRFACLHTYPIKVIHGSTCVCATIDNLKGHKCVKTYDVVIDDKYPVCKECEEKGVGANLDKPTKKESKTRKVLNKLFHRH